MESAWDYLISLVLCIITEAIFVSLANVSDLFSRGCFYMCIYRYGWKTLFSILVTIMTP